MGRAMHHRDLQSGGPLSRGFPLPLRGVGGVPVGVSELQPALAPNFWPESFDRITEAVRYEKRVRTSLLYRELSLDRTLTPEAQETFLDRLPGGSGDFTNAVAFSDFLDRLPQELCRLSRSILSGYTLEETRSRLHWTGGELLSAVEDLRGALRAYEAT